MAIRGTPQQHKGKLADNMLLVGSYMQEAQKAYDRQDCKGLYTAVRHLERVVAVAKSHTMFVYDKVTDRVLAREKRRLEWYAGMLDQNCVRPKFKYKQRRRG